MSKPNGVEILCFFRQQEIKCVKVPKHYIAFFNLLLNNGLSRLLTLLGLQQNVTEQKIIYAQLNLIF